MSTRRMRGTPSPNRWITCLVVTLAIVGMLVCLGVYLAYRWLNEEPTEVTSPRPTGDIVLTVAYTPDKEALFAELVDRFNRSKPQTLEGHSIVVHASRIEPEEMIDASLAGSFDAISPDSSLWLTRLESDWRAQRATDASLVGETTRYAVSPVVIAMWEGVAAEFGAPERAIGWQDIMERARSDSTFRWSHPATDSASGLLATLAVFYAGAGKTRGLSEQDALNQDTLDYVGRVEKTVRFYGEAETSVIERAIREGPAFLDAFVVQEQLVVYFNRQATGARLVAVYPVEGTLWKDHPLALLEHAGLSPETRQAHIAFRDFVVSEGAQRLVLEQGYRPADLSIPLDGPDSPIKPANGVEPRQPQTTLQIPSQAVIEVVLEVWQYAKRQTNVYLVSDVSGSMEGDKLAQAQQAMGEFVAQIKGAKERVGLLTFASGVQEIVPLGDLEGNRSALNAAIGGLAARGNTALLDGVALAYLKLQELGDLERINAIVVMTDGRENRSSTAFDALIRTIQSRNQTGVPVVIFCIAYGEDADMEMLRSIAEASGGQARWGDLESIKELYKILSTYF